MSNWNNCGHYNANGYFINKNIKGEVIKSVATVNADLYLSWLNKAINIYIFNSIKQQRQNAD